jgi:hypothetical protein
MDSPPQYNKDVARSMQNAMNEQLKTQMCKEKLKKLERERKHQKISMFHRFTILDLPKDGFGTPDTMDLSTHDHQRGLKIHPPIFKGKHW